MNLKRTVDLSALGSSQAAKAVRAACLAKNDLTASMNLARELDAAGVQGLLFRALWEGMTIWSSSSPTAAQALTLKNEQQVIDQAKRIAANHNK